MQILIIILFILVTAFLVMAILGSSYNRQHTIVCVTHFKTDINKVWNDIINIREEQKWRKDVKKIELSKNEHNQSIQIETDKYGKKKYFVIDTETQEYIQKRIITNNKSFSGEWQIKLSRENSLTMVEITETGEIYNTVLRFLYHTFFMKNSTGKIYLYMLANYLNEKDSEIRQTQLSA